MNYLTVPLDAKHEKSVFCCGKDMLDNYVRKQAKQDVERKLAACFVFEEAGTKRLKGYYTLSNSSIPLEMMPDDFRTKLPPTYRSLPCTLLGRLAVDTKYMGQGIGKKLLLDALFRAYEISKTIGSFAVAVDPLDEEAEMFYEHFGFIKLPESGKMFLPMKTIAGLFA